MQPAEHWLCIHFADGDELPEHTVHVPLVHWNDVVETLLPDRPDHELDVRILPA